MKQSPPIPVLPGSTTHCIAPAAIAASAALPPERNTSRAAKVAIGCEVAAMPFAAIAADRPGTLKSRIVEPFAVVLRSLHRHVARRRSSRLYGTNAASYPAGQFASREKHKLWTEA